MSDFKALVVYDTNYGSTKMVAETIAREIAKETPTINVEVVKETDLKDLDLLVVGSPIIAWNPTARTRKFLKLLKSANLSGVKAAAFDTRLDISIHGDACEKIAKKLEGAGLEKITEPRFFCVADKEGPLADGELERAQEWGKLILSKMKA